MTARNETARNQTTHTQATRYTVGILVAGAIAFAGSVWASSQTEAVTATSGMDLQMLTIDASALPVMITDHAI